jgi:D-ribose pyranase
MKELGTINRGISRLISEQGHGDLLMVCDSGFAIPKGIEVVDISLTENQPAVLETLKILEKFFSVEKIIIADQTREISPSLFRNVSTLFGANIEVETVDHSELKKMAESVKGIIQTADFTAYGNVILVSGAGDRWYCEK